MPARSPEEVSILIGEAFNRGDAEAALALYEAGGTFVAQPGVVLTGHDAILQGINGFLGLKPTLNIEVTKVIPAGDTALMINNWTLTGTGPDGNPLNMGGQATEVVRRQADGTWLMVIDNPYGVA